MAENLFVPNTSDRKEIYNEIALQIAALVEGGLRRGIEGAGEGDACGCRGSGVEGRGRRGEDRRVKPERVAGANGLTTDFTDSHGSGVRVSVWIRAITAFFAAKTRGG